MKFNIGDKIVYRDGLGVVVDIVNSSDKTDVMQQGYRYYIKVRNQVWSVPEQVLRRP